MTPHDDDNLSFPAPPAPRRSDDAFARAVAADVDAVRKNRFGFNFSVAVPLVAGSAFAVVMAVSTSTPTPTTTPTTPITAPTTALVISQDADVDEFDLLEGAVDLASVLDDAEEGTLIALADTIDSDIDSDRFTFDALDGSTDQELADVEAALDSALRQL